MKPHLAWQLRAQLKHLIREFFSARGYLEIDTPIAVPCPGTEVHLRYFRTGWRDFRDQEHELWLRSSPELHMKQAMAQGLHRVFQLAPCFRNGGELSEWHHPEFTMLEWYETNISFNDFMQATADLLHFTAEGMTTVLEKAGLKLGVSLPQPMPRLTVAEAFREFAGLELIDGDEDLAAQAMARSIISVSEHDDFETAFFKILIEKIEPGLAALGPVFLYDYPASQAALANIRDGVAKRFEIYIGRVELCNGFEELLHAEANRKRVEEARRRRIQLGYEAPEHDEDFYAALTRGIPPSCGNALGFDRWLALVAGLTSIEGIVPFSRQGSFQLHD